MPTRPAWILENKPDQVVTLLARIHYPYAFTVVLPEENDSAAVLVDSAESTLDEKNVEYMHQTLQSIAPYLLGGGGISVSAGKAQSTTPDAAVGGKICDLCEMAHYTQWYAEYFSPFKFTILDCDSCDVPIAVLGEHRVDVLPEAVEVMERALNIVAERKYAEEFPKRMFDHNMRQIPDHYHFHVRPLLW